MTSRSAGKRKQGTRASVQAVSSILGIPAGEIIALIERGQIKAKRYRTQATIDVMCREDEYVIDWKSVGSYREIFGKRETGKSGAAPSAAEDRGREMTRRGSR